MSEPPVVEPPVVEPTLNRPPAYDRVFARVRAARSRLRARASLVLAGWWMAAAGLWLLAAVVVGGWFLTPAAPGLPLRQMLVGALVVTGLALVWRLGWRVWRATRPDAAVAEHLERGLAEAGHSLNDGLRASVQFGTDWPRQVPGSPALAATLAEQVAAQLDRAPLAAATPLTPARRPWAAAALVAGVWGLLGLLAPEHVARGFAALTAAPVDASGARETGPLVGDLTLTLHFPEHAQRPPRVLPNASGDIEALKGTRIVLQAVTLEPAQSVSLRFGDPDTNPGAGTDSGPARTPVAEGQGEQALTVKDGREVSGEFVVSGETLWRVAVVSAAGERQVEGVRRRIRLEADKPPEVVLKVPADDLTLEDLRRVAVAFEARDDFGLSEVSVVVALAEDPDHPEKVPQPEVTGLRFAAEDEIDLSIIQAEPGDRLALYVEAWDNNGVDGRQRGVSATRYLTVNSPQQKHFELSERLQALVDLLVDALADRLEMAFYAPAGPNAGAVGADPLAPLPARIAALMKRTDEAVATLAGVVADMTADPLTPEEVRLALAGRLGSLEAAVATEKATVEPETAALERQERAAVDGANKANDAVVDQLEQTIVLVEAMVARLALEDMAAMAEEIQAARERLRELVTQYKKNPDDKALKARIMRDVKRLRDRINEMRARMAALQQKLPEEFLNLDGMEKGEVSKGLEETKDALNDLEKLLDEGKIDEALAAIEEMEKALDELSDSLNKDMDDLHQESNPEMQKALSELMDQTRDLMRQQKTLSEETEAAAKAEQEAQRKLIEEELAEKLAELDAKAAELERTTASLDPRDLPRMAEEELGHLAERVASLRSALERKSLMEALEMANRGNEHLDGLERFTAYDSRAGESRKKVKQSQQLGQEIEKGLADLINEARKKSGPGGEGDQISEMARRQQQLGDATRKLRQRMGEKAEQVPGLGEQPMQKAQSAAEAMQQAGESLGQQRPGQARPGQQQAESELQGLMEGLKQANKPQRAERQQQQGREMSREKVEIPDAEAHQSPEAFRKDLLDAMKDKAPDQYREQVKRYYESLVR